MESVRRQLRQYYYQKVSTMETRPSSDPVSADMASQPGATEAVVADAVITTADMAKLPAECAALLDPQIPLPTGIEFFEKRVTFQELVMTSLSSLVLALIGVVALLIGITSLFSQRQYVYDNSTDWYIIFFGVTFLFASWMMLGSLRTRWELMQRQGRGEPTRLGIFLTPQGLMEANELAYTLIPRSQFVGVVGATVRYRMGGAEKSFNLPATLVRDTPAALVAAIQRWAERPA